MLIVMIKSPLHIASISLTNCQSNLSDILCLYTIQEYGNSEIWHLSAYMAQGTKVDGGDVKVSGPRQQPMLCPRLMFFVNDVHFFLRHRKQFQQHPSIKRIDWRLVQAVGMGRKHSLSALFKWKLSTRTVHVVFQIWIVASVDGRT